MGKLQKDEAFYKKLWSLMVPIVLQNLMLAMVAVADAFMLGGMDQNYMSAVSLATQIQFIQNMFLAAPRTPIGAMPKPPKIKMAFKIILTQTVIELMTAVVFACSLVFIITR